MRGVARTGAAAAAAGMLLAPAIWNRFPLLQYDTGGYLARWFEGYLVPSRSTVYGLFLLVGSWPDFWPAVVAQAALTVWVLALLLHALGLGAYPLALPAATAILCIVTTLPWLAGVLITDIFAGLAVVALHLLVFAGDSLRRGERAALVALIAFAASTHSATFAIVAALLVAGALSSSWFGVGARGGLVRGAIALALGAVMLVGANAITSGRLAWTPGGIALSFGRMLQDGIVARYLDDHCPNARLRLCAHRHALPRDADAFFWGQSVFNDLGRFDGLGAEMKTIVIESLKAYPLWQARAAATAFARQLVRIESGEGVLDSVWHTYAIVERYTPARAQAMRAARQQRGELHFETINRIHAPVALGAMLLLIPIMIWGLRHPAFAPFGRFAATTIVALLANAAICGIFANPHDRYGARLVWIAPLVVMLTLAQAYRQAHGLRQSAPAAQPTG